MRFPSFLPLALLAATSAFAQGGSAVITLVAPPPGGEGYSMLQAGGLFADGAGCSYYNPALLADLERHTGSQLHYTGSSQDLLPGIPWADLHQQFNGLAAVLPVSAGPGKGFDLGMGIYRNLIRFGDVGFMDADGNVLDTIHSKETVTGLAAGIRLGLPVSVGVAAKYIDSYLMDYLTPEGERKRGASRSWAFDVGVLANPRLSPSAALGLPWFEAVPSLSAGLRNIGRKVYYVDKDDADPIPRTFAFGMGLRFNLFDVLDFETAATQDREFPRLKDWDAEPVYNEGFSISILCFRASRGWLDDDSGKRWESHEGQALELDMLRMYRIWKRFQTGDFRSPPAAMEKGYPLARIRVLGISFRANPRLIIGTRTIESRDGGIRNGQDATFAALSL